jgi:hypothetical protein
MTKRPIALTKREKTKSQSRKIEEGNQPSINKDYSMYDSGRHSNEFKHLPNNYECPYAQKKPPLPQNAVSVAA